MDPEIVSDVMTRVPVLEQWALVIVVFIVSFVFLIGYLGALAVKNVSAGVFALIAKIEEFRKGLEDSTDALDRRLTRIDSSLLENTDRMYAQGERIHECVDTVKTRLAKLPEIMMDAADARYDTKAKRAKFNDVDGPPEKDDD